MVSTMYTAFYETVCGAFCHFSPYPPPERVDFMLSKREYDVLKKVKKLKIPYSVAGFSKINSNTDFGRHMLDELYRYGYIESTGNHFTDKSEDVFFVLTPRGTAVMTDYKHTLNKERFNRAFNFISGLVVGLVSGFGVTAFSFWMMVRLTP